MKDKIIKENISELIKISGGNQSDFARNLGLKPSHLSMVLSSRDTGISASILLKLAEYGGNMNWLLLGKGKIWQKELQIDADSEARIMSLKAELEKAKAVIDFTERILKGDK